MKYINHLFEIRDFNIDKRGYIPSGACCKYCGVNIYDVFTKLPVHIKKLYENFDKLDKVERVVQENKLINEHQVCITEDEFIIKNIIE